MIENLTQNPAVQPTRKDLRSVAGTVADNAARIAQSRVVDPAVNALRHTREAVRRQASAAEHFTAQQCDHLAHQISARPFTAISIAFAAGVAVATLFGFAFSRRD